jgi:DNA polymerase
VSLDDDWSLDFETRSAINLTDCGSHVYARHPSTTALMLSHAKGDAEPELWLEAHHECPPALHAHVEAGGRLRAWNAHGFEALIWEFVMVPRYGWPRVRPDQWVCTMQEALALGLPGKLATVAKVLRLPLGKDARGTRLINELCVGKPVPGRNRHTWRNDPDKMQALGEYCLQDLRVERAIARRMLRLTPPELELARLDALINRRGMGVDLRLVDAMLRLVDGAMVRFDRLVRETTNGRAQGITDLVGIACWLADSFDVRTPNGSLAKPELLRLLADPALPGPARVVIQARIDGGMASVKKLRAMRHYGATLGQRMRGLFAFLGAASTGRWAGRGPQPQNLPRATLADVEAAVAAIYALVAVLGTAEEEPAWAAFEAEFGPVLSAVSSLLRGCIVPGRGNVLWSCDLSGIESRVLAWLAGDERKLELFRSGGDPYLHTGSSIFGRPITKADKFERLVGKVAELACGYQGAVGAFQSMAAGYNVEIPDDMALKAVKGWREAHPLIVAFWYALNRAAIAATENPGELVRVAEDGVASTVQFIHAKGHLWCRLPSGRKLRYTNARLGEQTRKFPDGTSRTDPCVIYDTQDNSKNGTKQWGPVNLYGGLLAENVTQATARDVLVLGMRGIERQRRLVVGHVHDELVIEASANDNNAGPLLKAAMIAGAPWTRGLPLDAELDGPLRRYRK